MPEAAAAGAEPANRWPRRPSDGRERADPAASSQGEREAIELETLEGRGVGERDLFGGIQ